MNEKSTILTNDFMAIFKALKSILKKHEKRCVIDLDTDTEYFLNSKKRDQQNKPIFFAGVSINKISVSFYLMAVYSCPELRASLSPELRKCLHGKSCFRFKRNEPVLFRELTSLTKQALEQLLAG